MALHPDNNPHLIAVKQLREYDHAFMSPLGVEHFAKAFGVTLIPTRHEATIDRDPKGLMLPDGVTSAIGMDAAAMACGICRQLGVEYEGKFGRGSQLRACCDALEAHFSK